MTQNSLQFSQGGCNVCSRFHTIDSWGSNLDPPPTQLLQEIVAHCPLQTSGICRNLQACLASYFVQNWKCSKEPKWTNFVDSTGSSSCRCTGGRPVIFEARHEAHTGARSTVYAQGRVPPSHTFVQHFVYSCWIRMRSSAVSSRVPLRGLHLLSHGTWPKASSSSVQIEFVQMAKPFRSMLLIPRYCSALRTHHTWWREGQFPSLTPQRQHARRWEAPWKCLNSASPGVLQGNLNWEILCKTRKKDEKGTVPGTPEQYPTARGIYTASNFGRNSSKMHLPPKLFAHGVANR